MASRFLLLVSMLTLIPLAVPAQQPERDLSLNPAQREGRRIYQQRCAVCHVPASPVANRYARELSKRVVSGNEEAIRKIILDGTANGMPGWKYALEPKQVDALMDYLKTLEQPPSTVASERNEM